MNDKTISDFIEQESVEESTYKEYMEMERLYLDGDLEV